MKPPKTTKKETSIWLPPVEGCTGLCHRKEEYAVCDCGHCYEPSKSFLPPSERILSQALSVAQKHNQIIGRDGSMYITLEQLETLLK